MEDARSKMAIFPEASSIFGLQKGPKKQKWPIFPEASSIFRLWNTYESLFLADASGETAILAFSCGLCFGKTAILPDAPSTVGLAGGRKMMGASCKMPLFVFLLGPHC